MARINIYVADELHRQMAHAERGTKISWSAIAQQAFEIEIACITGVTKSNHSRETLIAQCNVWLRGIINGRKKSA